MTTRNTLTTGGRHAISIMMRRDGYALVAGSDMKRTVRNMHRAGEIDYTIEQVDHTYPNGTRKRDEYKVTIRK